MRPTYNLIAGLSLVLFAIVWCGFLAGFFAFLVFAIASFLSSMLPMAIGNSRRGLGKKYEYVLETGLPVSPFVEKVRWALDKLQVLCCRFNNRFQSALFNHKALKKRSSMSKNKTTAL